MYIMHTHTHTLYIYISIYIYIYIISSFIIRQNTYANHSFINLFFEPFFYFLVRSTKYQTDEFARDQKKLAKAYAIWHHWEFPTYRR